MGYRLTIEKRREAGPDKVQAFWAFAKRIGCVVVGDNATCSQRQKELLIKWWKDHAETPIRKDLS
jgi:hypothetical protein